MDKGIQKKKEKLGMNPSTARNRLVKELLYKYVKLQNEHICYRCKKEIINTDDFTIEHKEAWLNSDNPIKLYFDIDNVAFSHHVCNVKNGEKLRGSEHPGSKKVKGINIKNGKIIKFNSIVEAAKYIDENYNYSGTLERKANAISENLIGLRKRIYNYKWKYN